MADASHDLRRIGQHIERKFDVIIAAAIGCQPEAARWREDREGESFYLQCIREHPCYWNRHIGQKGCIRQLCLGQFTASLLCSPSSLIDCSLQTVANDRDFHAMPFRLIWLWSR
jgi:hypothetical protein